MDGDYSEDIKFCKIIEEEEEEVDIKFDSGICTQIPDYFSKTQEINDFKYIKCTKRDENNNLSMYFEERQTQNQAPIDYIIERWKSFGNQNMLEMANLLQKFKLAQDSEQRKALLATNCQFDEKKKEDIINYVIRCNQKNLMCIMQREYTLKGIKVEGWHFTERFINMLGWDVDDFEMHVLRNGLPKFRGSKEYKIFFLDSIYRSMYKQNGREWNRELYFIKKNGEELILKIQVKVYVNCGLEFMIVKYQDDFNQDNQHRQINIISEFQQNMQLEERTYLQSIKNDKIMCDYQNMVNVKNRTICGFKEINQQVPKKNQ
ncbi:hypothetical protein PPERSA_10426 [Pseudocohnilembus persalinus]|uniref:Uncharacterized protein n=1 Tax=Pseudocohnilembus persalinus TaxID=266149 RepID=A0A0V0QXB2_PSEPJ|nr:hypothetical protein PPERSA_10426 [Pseudocohnilembus persalinus]|eukprot:KRX06568.1 hypothetical protein PPERSA_10426 [Pseudocohnilembus persalinus]